MGSVIATYRKQWPRLGAALAMAVAGATAFAEGKRGTPRALVALNYWALLVQQYEEYVDPGWFPGQFNKGVFKSRSPRDHPLNTNTALCVNTAVAYPFYIAPILFPNKKWLGLGPVLFGMTQAVGHGVIFPRIAGDRYSPGFLTSILLHVPIGVAYIRSLRGTDGPITGRDSAEAAAYQWAVAVAGVAGPNPVGRNPDSPVAFEDQRMGHDATEDEAVPAAVDRDGGVR